MRDIDAEAEAASVLVTIAGATARSGGLFALMVDEFEHLMAENQRHGTHRNATAVKRLLEGLSGAGALVLVAGHWRAWEQLPDFKARFAGQPPVDLVTLTGKEIGQLVMKALPEWGMRLDEAALEAVAEAGGRNIRRVLAVLHQLFSDTAGDTGPIGAPAAEAAAEKRRKLTAETGRPDVVIEEAVRAATATTAGCWSPPSMRFRPSVNGVVVRAADRTSSTPTRATITVAASAEPAASRAASGSAVTAGK